MLLYKFDFEYSLEGMPQKSGGINLPENQPQKIVV